MAFKEKIDTGLAVLKARFLGRRIPTYVQLAVTNRCNARCRYCTVPDRMAQELTREEIFSVVDQLKKIGMRRITLLGGEPLLRDDIGPIIRYIKNKGIYCGLITNGFSAESKLDEIKGLDTLSVSIDGDEKINDDLRGPGSYARAIEALRMAKERGMRLFLGVTMTKMNMHSLDFILSLAKRFNCQALINIVYHSTRHSLNAKEVLATNDEYKKLLNEILAQKKKGAPILPSWNTYKLILDWPDYSQVKIGKEGNVPHNFPKCQAGKLFCYIDAAGDLYPCPLVVEETEALNCIEKGVKKAWEYSINHDCRACSVACFIEYNSLFSLTINSVLNAVKTR